MKMPFKNNRIILLRSNKIKKCKKKTILITLSKVNYKKKASKIKKKMKTNYPPKKSLEILLIHRKKNIKVSQVKINKKILIN